jgi:NitT/TauT family transport system permease protein
VAFVLIQPRRIRESLKRPASLGADLLVLLVLGGIAGALFSFSKQVAAPFRYKVDIDLSLWALPKYAMFSLARGFAAYALSLIFTLIYGTIAANNRLAERVMIPALDVLQSLPVLAFLPGVVLAMTKLFPAHEFGLEIACVVTIFTAQAWNMTFSYYSSVRSIPQSLREVSAIQHLSRWRFFRLVEAPASMIGLVWNSMMSMAGGWFVLNVSESFSIGVRDFRLPGIGSYMSEANLEQNKTAQVAGIMAMIVMIVAVDQLFWRPIVVWSERFKVEETAESEKAQSWVLTLLHHSSLYRWIMFKVHGMRQRHSAWWATRQAGAIATAPRQRFWDQWRLPMIWLALGVLAAGAIFGTWDLLRLLAAVPLSDPLQHNGWKTVLLALGASFLRVLATVVLAALWALPAGILIGLSPKWSQRLQPIVQVAASFPANMIYLPLTVVLLSWGIPFNIGCVALMLLGTQWYVLFNVIAGAMAIPTELKEVSLVYRTPWLRRWTRVYIPGVFPYLVTGLITAAGGAWNTTIIAEFVQTADPNRPYTAFGIGSIITQALNADNFPLLAAGAVTLALAVVIINRFMWRRLYRLAERRYSLNV